RCAPRSASTIRQQQPQVNILIIPAELLKAARRVEAYGVGPVGLGKRDKLRQPTLLRRCDTSFKQSRGHALLPVSTGHRHPDDPRTSRLEEKPDSPNDVTVAFRHIEVVPGC